MNDQNNRWGLVIFDCDGVLVDSEMLASQSLAKLLSELGHPHTPERCRDRFTGHTIPGLAKIVNADAAKSGQGPALPDDFVERLRAMDWAVFEAHLTALAGVERVLDDLDARGLPYCVASNGRSEKIEHSLTLVGLWPRFAGRAFSASQVVRGKPAPDLCMLAAATLGVAPARCLVIEDSVLGVAGAVAAGMTAVGFLGGSHISDATGPALLAAGAKLTLPHMDAVRNWFYTASA